MENKSEIKNGHIENTDDRIAAVRELIFGDNIKQYNSEFDELSNKIKILEEKSSKDIASVVEQLEHKISDLENLLDHKFQELSDDLDKKIADLDEEKADRKKLGKALEKIALMLQE